MAKSFLKYGTAKGLGKSIDYQSIINQRMQNERLLGQTRQQAMQRAQAIAERLNPYETEVEWLTEDYEPIMKETMNEMKQMKKDNPEWMYSIEGQMKFNEISRGLMDNEVTRIGERSKKEYDLFRQNMSGMSSKALTRETEKYQQYVSGEVRKPYIFDGSEPFVINDAVSKAAENLSVDTNMEGFTWTSEVNQGKLEQVANNTYFDNKRDWDDVWDGIENKELYGGSIKKYIQKSIRAAKEEQSYYDYKAAAAMTNANTRRSQYNEAIRDYYGEEVGDPETLKMESAVVNRGWLVTTDADIEDPEKGGLYNKKSGLFSVTDGVAEQITVGDNFKSIKLINATDGVTIKGTGENDPTREMIKVTAEVMWDDKNVEDYLKTIGKFESFYSAEDGSKNNVDAYAAIGAMFSGREGNDGKPIDLSSLGQDQKNTIQQELKANKYIATFWVPINRESRTAMRKYNQYVGGVANERKQGAYNVQGYPSGTTVEGWGE